ncbi:MAG: MogA/MoaB family molybdenum cofactor biosynthesis protein [Spirochaetota bacterium]
MSPGIDTVGGASPPLCFMVITVSDRAARGEYTDRSGPAVVEVLGAAFPESPVKTRVVPDEGSALRAALAEGEACDVVLTTGGTGPGPRDITPEVTREHCERELPGVAEALRRESYAATPTAMLSRGYAGIKAHTVYVNLPGSVSGARECTALLTPVLPHAVETVRGGSHE